MARKNRRDNHVDPIDIESLSSEPPPPLRVHYRYETPEERDDRLHAEYQQRKRRSERRSDERTAALVDWDKCCIPGCDQQSFRTYGHLPGYLQTKIRVDQELPVCRRHTTIIAKQAEPHWNDPDVLEMRQQFAFRRVTVETQHERTVDLQHENAGAEQGQIYFLRLNGIIKVGWSKKLRSRLKAYGASAEVLCHYPATRQEETDLHRSLRPYLTKGREWYAECRLIDDLIAAVIEKHGPPTVLPHWTEPKPEAIKPKGWTAA